MITDTQILSYYYKGRLPVPNEDVRVSSITAAEFLLIQSQNPSKANYYPILPCRFGHGGIGDMWGNSSGRVIFNSRRHAANGKHRTDQIILNFGPSVPTYIEFGSLAIAQLINDRNEQLYLSGIAHLDKRLQKKLRDRFRYLLDIGVDCVALNAKMANVGMNLLAKFMDAYQTKENKRNTINDVLLLATAIEKEVALFTADNLLKRFTAEVMGASVIEYQGNLVLDFSVAEVHHRRRPFESKGYINRGWQVLERRGG